MAKRPEYDYRRVQYKLPPLYTQQMYQQQSPRQQIGEWRIDWVASLSATIILSLCTVALGLPGFIVGLVICCFVYSLTC